MATLPTLAERLRARIESRGPVTFRDWMEAALYDHRGGYYRRRDLARWGSSGDYRTSPERTPLFAAAFAHHFAALHEQLGSPELWTILEAGAGAGHFARAALETLSRDHPRLFAATRYLIDEVGEESRERIAARLSDFSGRFEFGRLEELGDGELGAGLVFSNELLDALPAHRVRRSGGLLLELSVGLDGAGNFAWVERGPSTQRLAEYFSEQGIELAEGQSAEVNLAAEEWIARADTRSPHGLRRKLRVRAARRDRRRRTGRVRRLLERVAGRLARPPRPTKRRPAA